jgi:hypothetical protein
MFQDRDRSHAYLCVHEQLRERICLKTCEFYLGQTHFKPRVFFVPRKVYKTVCSGRTSQPVRVAGPASGPTTHTETAPASHAPATMRRATSRMSSRLTTPRQHVRNIKWSKGPNRVVNIQGKGGHDKCYTKSGVVQTRVGDARVYT